jgi:predicted nucleic acid-binding protein
MPHLVDTNILLRWQRPSDPLQAVARLAVESLIDQGERLYISAQNLIEFWNVATRPAAANGMGMTPTEADAELGRLEAFFLFAADNPAIYPEWRRLVVDVGVSGVQVHDARLVAVMRVHGLTHVLTFNPRDFARFPGITAVRPQEIAPVPPPAMPDHGAPPETPPADAS